MTRPEQRRWYTDPAWVFVLVIVLGGSTFAIWRFSPW